MRIGEASRRSGVSARMLRYYEKLGLVVPSTRTRSGYREYSHADLSRLFRVEALRALGLSLSQIGAALNAGASSPEQLIPELIARSRERIAHEQELLTRLEHLGTGDPEDWDEALTLVRLARGLESADAIERQRAALELGTEQLGPVSDLVTALLQEDEPNVSGTLRWALVRSNTGPGALAAGLSDGAPAVRGRAIRTIAAFPDAEATSLLLRGLQDAAPENRTEAALALATRGEHRAVPELVRAIVAGRQDVLAAEALGVLARTPTDAGDSIDAGEIVNAVREEIDAPGADPKARSRLTQALGDLASPEQRALLELLTADSDRTVARIARYLLEQ